MWERNIVRVWHNVGSLLCLTGQTVSPQSQPANNEGKQDVSRENSAVDFSKVSKQTHRWSCCLSTGSDSWTHNYCCIFNLRLGYVWNGHCIPLALHVVDCVIHIQPNSLSLILLPYYSKVHFHVLVLLPSASQIDLHFMKKIPPGAEASNVLVGELEFLDRPVVAFIRLSPAVLLNGLAEVPITTRLYTKLMRWYSDLFFFL